MSLDLKIANSDIVRKDGKTVLAYEKEELLQNIKNKFLTRQGEYFLDTSYGLDYNGVFPINTKIIDEDIQKLTIRECVSTDERIISVDNVSVSPLNNLREIEINFKAKSIYGALEEGVEIG